MVQDWRGPQSFYAASVALTNDPTAPKVYLTEANFKARYPWSYAKLLAKCRSLYLDFKQNAKFHQLHKSCVGNAKYSMTRLMDPDNPKSSKQTFFRNRLSIVQAFLSCSTLGTFVRSLSEGWQQEGPDAAFPLRRNGGSLLRSKLGVG